MLRIVYVRASAFDREYILRKRGDGCEGCVTRNVTHTSLRGLIPFLGKLTSAFVQHTIRTDLCTACIKTSFHSRREPNTMPHWTAKGSRHARVVRLGALRFTTASPHLLRMHRYAEVTKTCFYGWLPRRTDPPKMLGYRIVA